MTTTKYASPLAKAQAKLAEARRALTVANASLNVATGHRLAADASEEHWAQQFPGLARLPDRPTWRGRDGLAVNVDGTPYMIEGHQATRADIWREPPVLDETLAALAEVVTKAKKKEAAALKAEAKAHQEWVPTETGWIVLKPKRIAGVQYAIGDSFDPTTVEPRKVERFKRTGLIGHA